MTNDEILLLVDSVCPRAEFVRAMSNPELVEFAKAVAAKEREACAEIVDDETDEWESRDICAILRTVSTDIRARGE